MPDSPFATYMPDVQSLRLVDALRDAVGLR